jgi:hypothetical protein
MGEVIDISEKYGITGGDIAGEEMIPKTARVVALSGWRNSGKDTVADHLVERYGYIKLSFANILKDMVADQYNIPRANLDDRTLKEAPITSLPVIDSDPFSAKIHEMLRSEFREGFWTPRALCILEGSIKRSVYSNYWVRRVIDRIKDETNADRRYVISDMRYKSEADTLSMLLARNELLMVRINRFETIDTEDPSERNLDDYSFDITFGNHAPTIAGLHTSLDWLCATIGLVTT